MGKTNKTDVNWVRFHGDKTRLSKKDKKLLIAMDANGSGLRSGNHRKWQSKAKITERKKERAKQKEKLQQIIKDLE